jgi:uncharacterized membrane protein YedE/YeeE
MIANTFGAPASALVAAVPWPFWAGGLGIGLFLLTFLLVEGRQLGVSTGYLDAYKACFDSQLRGSWRLLFLAGIASGGALSAWLSGTWQGRFDVPMFDAVVTGSLVIKAMTFTLGGILLGLGSRLAGGCTSGHSILGISLLSGNSLRITLGFMLSGVVFAHLLYGAGS